MRVLSLGAGVQSTTMALMAAHGEIGPMPDCAIFANTGEEPEAVYDHLRWLASGNVLPFPVHIIETGPLGDRLFDDNEARIPVFTDTGMRRRQCTKNYKLLPIRRKIRQLLGKGPRDYIAPGTVEQWIGISTDEIFRVTPSRVQFITRRDPLIELQMSRWDCTNWLTDHGYPIPPKSSCVFCPYKGNAQWASLRDNDPKGWSRAVAVDARLRTPAGIAMFKKPTFLHRSAVPLAKADLSKVDAHLFNNECEGMCGV
ncbi:hypothetical protein H8A97_12940 [Bradyrhizobium sp. Arg62]|uniref:hypothetical protein n=1 Tax=Bradyrhizobium brasilense TaxID=1419277 RepID=UPI001E60A307|nr:hypothetical protein [Bradyrhizobium brasilense]MCC8945979.1 hypothetical protein [Bradyrhizobium brasilense]